MDNEGLNIITTEPNMDTANILKQKVDSGEITDLSQARAYLDRSEILKRLLSDFDMDVLNILHRLNQIAEIPFAHKQERVQIWLYILADRSFCGDGFSITGEKDDLLSCYNSMITSVLIRMDYTEKFRIDSGVEWILQYQHVERGLENRWPGSRILKYGGCMKSTPCYIGLVKSMIALSDYKKKWKDEFSKQMEAKLAKGLDYILDHQVYIRKSDEQPITRDIAKLTYPFSYKTNVVEILRLLRDNHLDSDSRCDRAKNYLQSKRRKDGFWRVNSSYLPKYWVTFDRPNENGYWITSEITKLIGEIPKQDKTTML